MKNYFKNSIFRNVGFLLPILIIFSSLKTFGYVTTFFLYIPYLIHSKDKLIYAYENNKSIGKKILLFFSFIFLEIIHGTYFIKDIRVSLFWIPFVLVVISSYFKNLYDINVNTNYKKNYINIIYKACVIYFLLYFIVGIIAVIKYGQFYKIQDYFWIGSSGAFTVSSILFYTLSKLWDKKNYGIFSSYSLFFLFYIFMVLTHESRVGMVYISSFLIYLSIKNIQLKQFLNLFLIISLTLSGYATSALFISQFSSRFNYAFSPPDNSGLNRNLIRDTSSILKRQDGREDTFFKGLNQFKKYPTINKIIGTGWYSSRITLNQDKSEIRPIDYRNIKITWPPAVLAYVLDTGLIGVIFSIYLILINTLYIIKSKEDLINKIFFTFLLGITFLNVFVGYPLVNIAYILFLLPDGIIQTKTKI